MFEIEYEKDALNIRYVHETLKLGYVSTCYGYERLIKMIGSRSTDKKIRLGYL